ncbi:hypothetical protein KXS07_31395 [Inquilinus limosus]|uniref:hypothetical protein n=1 Tax=Inquilinus limosus TaxID=171674 RepID=UPI003F147126
MTDAFNRAAAALIKRHHVGDHPNANALARDIAAALRQAQAEAAQRLRDGGFRTAAAFLVGQGPVRA